MQKAEVEMNNPMEDAPNMQRCAPAQGTNVEETIRRFGILGGKIMDFRSTVNPLGPSPAAVRAAKRSLAVIDRFPQPDAGDLRKAISRYYGIKPDHVVCGNGSNSLIHLIPRIFRPKKVLIPVPTYSEYITAAREAGAQVAALQLNERDGFRVDPLEMAFALKGMDMAFLCNPNNPTGLLMPKPEMLEIVRYAHEQGARLVVDECFMDFVNAESIVKDAVQTSHLICLRSFSTFFGMPGLRIGYAVADEATADSLRTGQERWSVNITAEHAAIEALQDWRYARKIDRLIAKERERILSAVRILPGVETFPCSANFIFIKIPAPKAPLLVEKLALRGILVRDCSSFPGLNERFIRISVRTRPENKRLIRALRELLGP